MSKFLISIQVQVPFLLLLSFFSITTLQPANAAQASGITGAWVFNEELSDNTDRQVEASLRAAGEKVKRSWFRKTKDKYRGGPPEQELYDHISYDSTLSISLNEPEYEFIYEDNYSRPVFTDNRSQTVTLNRIEEIEDFSFAHWQGEALEVEARPRDGGFANERYTLINAGTQLKVELYIKPGSFQKPIEIIRIYDRFNELETPLD